MRIITKILAFPIRWIISPFINLFNHFSTEPSITDLKTFSYTKKISFLQLLLLGVIIKLIVVNPTDRPLLIGMTLSLYLFIMPVLKMLVTSKGQEEAWHKFGPRDEEPPYLPDPDNDLLTSALEIGFIGEHPCPFFNALFSNPNMENKEDRDQFLLKLISPINKAYRMVCEEHKQEENSDDAEENIRLNLQMFLTLSHMYPSYSSLMIIAEYVWKRMQDQTLELTSPRSRNELITIVRRTSSVDLQSYNNNFFVPRIRSIRRQTLAGEHPSDDANLHATDDPDDDRDLPPLVRF